MRVPEGKGDKRAKNLLKYIMAKPSKSKEKKYADS